MLQGCAACCCSGEGLFVLQATGNGRLLFSSFGGIMRYDLKAGEVVTRPLIAVTRPCFSSPW